MTKHKTLKIYWDKETDAETNCRLREIRVSLPVTKELNDEQEWLLSLSCSLLAHDWVDDGRVYTIKLGSLSTTPTIQELMPLVDAEIKKLKDAKQAKEDEEKAKKEKEIEKVNNMLREWLAKPDFEDRSVIDSDSRFSHAPPYSLNYRNGMDQDLIKKVKQNIEGEHERLIQVWLADPRLVGCFPLQLWECNYSVYSNVPECYKEKVEIVLAELEEQKHLKEMKAEEEEERIRVEFFKKRLAIVKTWAAKHGSDRLKKQLAQGLDGWALFLDEKVAYDFRDFEFVEIDNSAPQLEESTNPSEVWLDLGNRVAAVLVKLKLAPNKQEAFEKISYRVRETCEGREYYVLVEDYCPGGWFKGKDWFFNVLIN